MCRGRTMDFTKDDSSPLPPGSAVIGFSQLLDQHPDPAWIYDLESLRFVTVNGALEETTGYSRDDLLSLTLIDIVQPDETSRILRAVARARSESSPLPLKEIWRCKTRSGGIMELETSSYTLNVQGRPCRMVVARHRSEGRATVDRRDSGVNHDHLTGLADRTSLLEHLRRRSPEPQSSPRSPFAVFLIALDRFQQLNRSLGRELGDHLLVAAARRLGSFVHPDEALVRLGGVEFALLLEGVGSAEAALHMAREIQEALEAPFDVNGQDVHITASVGMALSSPNYPRPEELLKDAESALHEAQAQGIGRSRLFASEARAGAERALRIEMELRPGLERGDFKVHFQPIVSLRTNMLAGFEALARWQHPKLGLIMPSQFIPMAERMGLIGDLGLRVLRESCRQVREWQTRFPSDPPLFLTVNCSAAQFFDPKLAMHIRWALSDSGLPPKTLKLELTESVVMEDNPRSARPFDRILELGVQLIIDDFGTGFSSLSRLHQLPIEALKIDRTFVEGIPERMDSHSVIQAIIQLARNFALKVTAEGVENAEQLRVLRGMGCDYVQGYYFAKPLEPKQSEELLSAGRKW